MSKSSIIATMYALFKVKEALSTFHASHKSKVTPVNMVINKFRTIIADKYEFRPQTLIEVSSLWLVVTHKTSKHCSIKCH